MGYPYFVYTPIKSRHGTINHSFTWQTPGVKRGPKLPIFVFPLHDMTGLGTLFHAGLELSTQAVAGILVQRSGVPQEQPCKQKERSIMLSVLGTVPMHTKLHSHYDHVHDRCPRWFEQWRALLVPRFQLLLFLC